MSKDPVRVYHNPRCGKSRSACALLTERGVAFETVEYLKSPPTRAELEALLRLLGIPAEALLRKGEAVFKEHYKDRPLDEAACIQAMLDHPILMERPVVVVGERAVIGRPPEKVLELLD